MIGVDDLSMGSPRNLARPSRAPQLRAARVRLPRRGAPAPGLRRLRRDRAPRRAEDPPLRRRAEDAAGQRRRLRTPRSTSRSSIGAPSCSPPPRTCTATPTPPFREDDPIVLGPPTTRRWSYAASKYYDEHLALRHGRGARPEGHDPALLQRLRRPQPPVVVGRPAVACSSRTCSTAARWSCTATAGRSARSPTSATRSTASCARSQRPEASGEVINIGNDEPITIIELAADGPGGDGHRRARCAPSIVPLESMRRQLPGRARSASPTPRRPPRCSASTPQVSLEEGLEKTIAWHHALRGGARSQSGRARERRDSPRRSAVRRLRSARPRCRRSTARRRADVASARSRRACWPTRSTCSPRGRSGPRRTAPSARCGRGMFLLAVLLFRPLEQTVSRAVADHVARGDGRPRAVRARPRGSARRRTSPALLGAASLAWAPLTDGLFGGRAGADRRADGRPRRLRALLLRARPRRRRALVRRLRPRAARRRRRSASSSRSRCCSSRRRRWRPWRSPPPPSAAPLAPLLSRRPRRAARAWRRRHAGRRSRSAAPRASRCRPR